MNNKESRLRFFCLILLFFAMYFSFAAVSNLLKYDILTLHDTIFSYGRTFLNPEHGRFIATYFNNLTTEVIPELLNIHPNDFQQIAIVPFKAVCVIVMCLLITNAAFIFSKRKLNLAFVCLYLLVFLLLFNNFFFFNHYGYCDVVENTSFYEYPLSLLLFMPFFSIIAYYFVNKIFPPIKVYIILYILAFFLGISVDPVNVPSSLILLLLGFHLIKDNKKRIFEYKKELILIIILYIIYFIAMGFYFIRPVHHFPNYSNYKFCDYILNFFIPYTKTYINLFLFHISMPLLPVFLIMIILPFIKNYNKNKHQFIIYILIHAGTFLLFYFMLFLLGFNGEENTYWTYNPKWTDLYKATCLFYLLMTVGYLIDSNAKISESHSVVIKILLIFITIAILHKPLITDYWQNLNNYSDDLKELRKTSYICEKLAINQNSDKIILPEDMKRRVFQILFDDNNQCGLHVYIRNIHPEIIKTGIEFSDNVDMSIFSDEELNTLRFQNLLQHRMYRHEKIKTGCW